MTHLLGAARRVSGRILVASALALTGLAPARPVVVLSGTAPAAGWTSSGGYWLVTADGTVLPYGDADIQGPNRNQGPDIVAMARTADAAGYWNVDDDGDVFAYGAAPDLGSRTYNADDVVGIAARPQGDGYWMVATDGGIFSYGDAEFFGSLLSGTPRTPGGAITLNRPIVGMASTPTGRGYWLVATDGGIFAFGDAEFFGSTGAMRLNRPIVGVASTGTGGGYWLAATDGGIFSFGDAPFHGSAGALPLPYPVVGIVATPARVKDDRPAAAPDSAVTDEDTPVTVDVLANDAGLGDGPLAVAILDAPDHGSASVDGDGRITYRPAANYAGGDSLVYQVADGDGDAAQASLVVTVRGRNDAPVAGSLSLTTPESTTLAGIVVGSDVDGDALTFSLGSPPAHGTVTLAAGGSFAYTPARDYSGPDAFTVTVTDGRGGTATATVAVSVVSVDDPPTITAIADVTVTSGATSLPQTFSVADPDTPEGSLQLRATSANEALVPSSAVTFGRLGPLRTVTVTPTPGSSGPVVVTVTVSDGVGSDSTAFTVTVVDLNAAPTITPIDDQLLALGAAGTGPIAFTVADADDLAGSLQVTASSSNPALVLDGGLILGGTGSDRTLEVQVVPAMTGSTDITVTTSDGTDEASTTFRLTVV